MPLEADTASRDIGGNLIFKIFLIMRIHKFPGDVTGELIMRDTSSARQI